VERWPQTVAIGSALPIFFLTVGAPWYGRE
jgi:hypothetical protein